ncbi:hypothetical protein P152DRAFT_426805 [Eremomyces bilateralis CBS 781.70]|uniref:Serine/threonine-protein kinase RIO2 n=1 Tax=Eremomyces bilateralis CBS 781.70 TaxID=1392243 RepID=A0A6G1GGW2_9PEZI|nr:uncharacterized protein P152DRAFT_426805 [Eremomyces bilateralis CBS 781.70]KAF1817176.1 hypothetical protein P152DRAFT_426805 [Eremomyces bilateralis CBS 781.70]
MKLDTKAMRYLNSEDWRVLTAVEMGSRNHEVVPTPLIGQISGLRGGSGVNRSIANLAKVGLIGRVKNARYDGYRLTYGGLDYLALNAHRKHDTIYSVGTRVGVGKESDIYAACTPGGTRIILKIHRLGRISFRQVKQTRDYLRGRSAGSWMYMSRLAAVKEHMFMKALYENNFPVPEPLGQSRHTVVMSEIDGYPMRQVAKVADPAALYADIISILLRLARYGLIHCDFNEFNILLEEVRETTFRDDEQPEEVVTVRPVVIDFPQMVSIDHSNAEYYFDRDVACIKRYFERRYNFISDERGPFFADAIKDVGKDTKIPRLDISVEASGFSKKMAKELEAYMKDMGVDGDGHVSNEEEDSGDDERAEEEEDEEEETMEAIELQEETDGQQPRDSEEVRSEIDQLSNHFTSSTVLEIKKNNATRMPDQFSVAGSTARSRPTKPAGWSI